MMDQIVLGNPLNDWLVAILVIALGWLLGRMARFVLTHWATRLTSATGTQLDDKVIARTAQPIGLIVLFAVTNVALDLLKIPAGTLHILSGILVASIAITVAVIVMRVLDAVFEELLEPWAARQAPAVHPQVLHIGKIILKFIAGTLAMITVMQRAGFDVWSVITGLGIGGVAVALGAQETLGNLFGSLQVMTDRPFGVGDMVTIDGFSGRVVAIGLRSTRLQNAAGKMIIMPNKQVAATTVENFMALQGQVREFMIDIAYETPPELVERACAALRDILSTTPGVHTEHQVHFWTYASSSLGLRVIYRVPDADQFGDVAHQVNMSILNSFNAMGVEFAYPTRKVWLQNTDAEHSRLHVVPDASANSAD